MKLLYLVNLFFVCCSSFIVQPGYLPMKFKSSNINYNHKYKNLELLNKKEIINLKKNNNDNDNDNDNNNNNNDNIKTTKRFIISMIYNIILYSYIFYLIHHL
jgi:hypothetical protein